MRLSEGQRLVRMQYVSKEVSEALVSQITKGFGIDINIIFGDIDIVMNILGRGIVAISIGTDYCGIGRGAERGLGSLVCSRHSADVLYRL